MVRILYTTIFLAAMSSFSAFASGISTHVLDLATGVGGKNVPVILEQKSKEGNWTKFASGVTDENGRIKSFNSTNKVSKGIYRLNFDMSKYSKKNPFFPEINVVFQIEDENLHYHVPVVVSPYGYSTYRGN